MGSVFSSLMGGAEKPQQQMARTAPGLSSPMGSQPGGQQQPSPSLNPYTGDLPAGIGVGKNVPYNSPRGGFGG